MRYQLVHPKDPDCEAAVTISHYTSWQACTAMLNGISRGKGIALWANDSNCLNDTVEGQALQMFAGHAVGLASNSESDLPYYISGKWPRSPSDVERYQPDESRDVPFISPEDCRKLSDALRTIYRLPELSFDAGQAQLKRFNLGAQIVSFCRDSDRLDLWRTYAEDGRGVSFVMPLRAAALAIEEEPWSLYRVAYDHRAMARAWTLLRNPLHELSELDLKKASSRSTAVKRSVLIQAALSRLFFLFKHEQFRSEREIRLLYTGEKRPIASPIGEFRTIMLAPPFFLKGADCSLILGPGTPDRDKRAAWLATRLARVFPRATPTVLLSSAPFRGASASTAQAQTAGLASAS